MSKIFYRVAKLETKQGLWYDYQGKFTGLIHDKFSFCKNKDLQMPYDPEVVGWLSSTETLDELMNWFDINDITRLEEYGYRVVMYEATQYKFHNNHWLIKQDSSVFIKHIDIKDLLNSQKSYGKITVGVGSENQRDLNIVEFLQSRYTDNRLITVSRIEDGTYSLTVENPESSGRGTLSQMWLSEQSVVGLISTLMHYFNVKDMNLHELLNNSINNNSVDYRISDNLIKDEH
jgi:hypothetical protein